MIGLLRGQVIHRQPPFMMIDVNGVGYELEAPLSTFYDLPEQGTVTLFTHLAVRDDAHVLYGFASESERSLFRSLLKVNGVGAKMALAILSGMGVDEFSRCVQSDDTASLVRLPGIGKKTAERLIIEMRDRLEKIDLPVNLSRGPATSSATGQVTASPVADAVGALIALGYKPNEASKLVRSLDTTDMQSEEIIRAALKSIAPGS